MAGESMVAQAAYLWAVAEFVSAVPGDPHDADVLATTQRLGAECRPSYPADAEGTDADECPVGQRDNGYQRGNGASNHQVHSGRRARSAYISGVPRLPGESKPGRDRTQSGGQLAGRSAIYAET